MDFKSFIACIKNEIADYLIEYEIEEIRIEEVVKNNGVVCTGLLLCQKEQSITPNIYLEEYYGLYRKGYELSEICELISQEYRKATNECIRKISVSYDFEDIKSKIFIKLINFDKNRKQLEQVPYVRYLNFAITFRYLVKYDEGGIASTLIHLKELERWGITNEELYELAKENTLRMFDHVIKPLSEVLDFNFPGETRENSPQMYIFTNKIGINGASLLLYPELLNNLAKQLETDLYILPSSIHEVLLVPQNDDWHLKEDLKRMVEEVNEYVVSDMDYLSDDVYCYKRDIHEIVM